MINEAAKYVLAACWNEDDLNVRFANLNLKIRGTWMLLQSKVDEDPSSQIMMWTKTLSSRS
jgi:hypothetical protein